MADTTKISPINTAEKPITAATTDIPKAMAQKPDFESRDLLILGTTTTGGALASGFTAEPILKKITEIKVKNSIGAILKPVSDFLTGKVEKFDTKGFTDAVIKYGKKYRPKMFGSDAADGMAKMVEGAVLERKILVEQTELLFRDNGALDDVIDIFGKIAPEDFDASNLNDVKNAVKERMTGNWIDDLFKDLGSKFETLGKTAGKKMAGLVHLSAKTKVIAGAIGGLALTGLTAIGLAVGRKLKKKDKGQQ